MPDQRLLDLDAYCAITCTLAFNGVAYYVNFVEVPALMAVKDTKSMRQCWKEIFLRAKKMQGALSIIGSSTALVMAYNEGSKYKWLWLGSAAALMTVWPWTYLVMMPDIKRLLDDNVVEKEGETWVRNKIQNWGWKHGFRTAISDLSCNLMIAALYFTRM